MFVKMYKKYDNLLLTMLGAQYFNQGTKVLINLASADLFKSYMHLEPGEVQLLKAFAILPWSLKIVYGLISDNVPLFGSRRKSYILFFSMLQCLTMWLLAMDKTQNESFTAWMLFVANLCMAFSDVIVDSLLVI